MSSTLWTIPGKMCSHRIMVEDALLSGARLKTPASLSIPALMNELAPLPTTANTFTAGL